MLWLKKQAANERRVGEGDHGLLARGVCAEGRLSVIPEQANRQQPALTCRFPPATNAEHLHKHDLYSDSALVMGSILYSSGVLSRLAMAVFQHTNWQPLQTI